MPDVTEPLHLRALTWNVHGFVGRRGRRDPDAVLAAIRELDADIVGLQEIDERSAGLDDIPAFIRVSEELGWHSAEARTIRTDEGDYGNALLSRWPIDEESCIDLSVDQREPRLAISCRVEAPAGPIRVVTAHLGLSDRERRYQIGLIKDHLSSVSESAAIVLGDFNEWRRVGITTRALCPPFELAPSGASFPARYPAFRLDRIWCRPPLAVEDARTVRDYARLSDHLPVVADLRFGDDDAPAEERRDGGLSP